MTRKHKVTFVINFISWKYPFLNSCNDVKIPPIPSIFLYNDKTLKQLDSPDKETSESNREKENISSEVREIYDSTTTTTTSNASHEDNDVVPDDDHDYAPKRY